MTPISFPGKPLNSVQEGFDNPDGPSDLPSQPMAEVFQGLVNSALSSPGTKSLNTPAPVLEPGVSLASDPDGRERRDRPAALNPERKLSGDARRGGGGAPRQQQGVVSLADRHPVSASQREDKPCLRETATPVPLDAPASSPAPPRAPDAPPSTAESAKAARSGVNGPRYPAATNCGIGQTEPPRPEQREQPAAPPPQGAVRVTQPAKAPPSPAPTISQSGGRETRSAERPECVGIGGPAKNLARAGLAAESAGTGTSPPSPCVGAGGGSGGSGLVELGDEWRARERGERGGTPAAPMLRQMKFALNRADFAGVPEQELPGGSSAGAADALGHPEENPTRAETRDSALPLAGVDVKSQFGRLEAGRTSSSPVLDPQRLLDQIDAQVKLVRSRGAERLSVVLRPDGKTEILLQLRLEGGSVQAQVRCHRGDFDALNADWARLQQTLSASGVRLAPLLGPLPSGELAPAAFKDGSSQPALSGRRKSGQKEGGSLLGHPVTGERARARQRGARLLESWA